MLQCFHAVSLCILRTKRAGTYAFTSPANVPANSAACIACPIRPPLTPMINWNVVPDSFAHAAKMPANTAALSAATGAPTSISAGILLNATAAQCFTDAAVESASFQWSHLLRGASVDDGYLPPYSGKGTVPAAFTLTAASTPLSVADKPISTLGVDFGAQQLALPAHSWSTMMAYLLQVEIRATVAYKTMVNGAPKASTVNSTTRAWAWVYMSCDPGACAPPPMMGMHLCVMLFSMLDIRQCIDCCTLFLRGVFASTAIGRSRRLLFGCRHGQGWIHHFDLPRMLGRVCVLRRDDFPDAFVTLEFHQSFTCPLLASLSLSPLSPRMLQIPMSGWRLVAVHDRRVEQCRRLCVFDGAVLGLSCKSLKSWH